MPRSEESERKFRDAASKAGYSDIEIDQYLKSTPETPPASPASAPPQQQSWPAWAGRKAAIIGGNVAAGALWPAEQLIEATQPIRDVVRPALGLPTGPTEFESSLPDPRSLAPTPQGPGEEILATGAQAAGAALPLMAAGAVGTPLALAGARALSTNLVSVPQVSSVFTNPRVVAAAAGGAAGGEARRQYFPEMPGGTVVDIGVGALIGGILGPRAAATAARLSPGARSVFGTAAGQATAYALHGLGVPSWLAHGIGAPVGMAAARMGGGLPALSGTGAAIGGTSSLLSGPVPED